MSEQVPSKKLSSGPWKVAIGSEQAMENWLVARTGHSIEHNDEVIYITTDHVHASMAVSYPFEDAEFIVRCRNYAMEYGDPVDEMEAVRKALREAGYVGDDPVAGIRGLRLLFDAERAENEPPAEQADREDMENIGRAFMDSIARNLPGYSWSDCPSEVIVDLINQRDDARATQPPAAVVVIPLEEARLIESAFLPNNPNRLRNAHRDVVIAAHRFKDAVRTALTKGDGQS